MGVLLGHQFIGSSMVNIYSSVVLVLVEFYSFSNINLLSCCNNDNIRLLQAREFDQDVLSLHK